MTPKLLSPVVLAVSEFSHEFESVIEICKVILLDLFISTVAAGIDFRALSENPTLIQGIKTVNMFCRYDFTLFDQFYKVLVENLELAKKPKIPGTGTTA